MLHNAAAAAGGQLSNHLVSMERSIQDLTKARRAILLRIEKEFPRYASYIMPKPLGIRAVQARLSQGEAFLNIWTLLEKTFVWVIPKQGIPVFRVIDMGKEEISGKVHALRNALKPDVYWLSEIPEFDLYTAYGLYERILKPVAPAWENARDLLVVIRGPLDQIPLAVLPTEPVELNHDTVTRFAAYENVPWLIRKVSISRLPSAGSLRVLKSLPPGKAEREAFAGFGDPVFRPASGRKPAEDQSRLASRGAGSGSVRLRGIRVTNLGNLEDKALYSVRIENLNSLPDTADELREIAATLGADSSKDLFLGQEASETRVKKTDLSRKKILVFATHALLPGDLDGLTQPALAFSSPEVTMQDEDGLLTMGEILTLKLDADLVVLSACDTGAGDGLGNEAVSGLGRAFFYSGARALLVTMWPVETTAARKLTTGLFRDRQKEAGISWGRAPPQIHYPAH